MGYMTKTQGIEIIKIATLEILKLIAPDRLYTDESEIEAILKYFKLHDKISEICDQFPDILRPPKIYCHDKLKALMIERE